MISVVAALMLAGSQPQPHLPKWDGVAPALHKTAGKTKPTVALARSINEKVNKNRYLEDFMLYGEFDFWARPAEFYEAGAGDCEDFAIAKFDELLKAGVAEKNIHLVVAENIAFGGAHSVLRVQIDGKFYYLDCVKNQLWGDEFLTKFRVFYAVNRLGVEVGNKIAKN